MKKVVNTYQLICDGCGEIFETSQGFTCYTDDPNSIVDEASQSNWLITSNDHHYCPNCHKWKVIDNSEEVVECKNGRRYNEEYEPI